MTKMDGQRGNANAEPRAPHIDIAIPKLRTAARQLADTVLDLLFPPHCIECNRVGSLLCVACQSKLQAVPPFVDPTSPLREQRATAIHDGAMRKAIHALKYESRYRLADVLGERLHQEFQRTTWNATLFTAAPLHPQRLQQRGYNQAALLGESLAKRAGKPFIGDAIRRVRDTRSQVGLDRQERRANVADAFEGDPTYAKDQYIVIVDDVYTTGATLRACAAALRQAGAGEVWSLTLAAAHHEVPT
jgi:ComF family protein